MLIRSIRLLSMIAIVSIIALPTVRTFIDPLYSNWPGPARLLRFHALWRPCIAAIDLLVGLARTLGNLTPDSSGEMELCKASI